MICNTELGYTVYYTLRTPNKHGRYSVHISLIIDGQKAKEKSTGIRVLKDDFNTKTGEIKDNLNDTHTLQNLKKNLEQHCFEFKRRGKYYTAEDVFDLMSGKSHKTFLQVYKEFAETKKALVNKTIEQVTARRYLTYYNEIAKFIRTVYKCSDIHISDADYSFCEKYKNWLYQEQGNQQETVRKKILVLRNVFENAILKDLTDKNPAKHIATERKQYGISESLTDDEVSRIKELTFTDYNKHLEKYRDLLLISILTACGYKELKNLHQATIKTDNDQRQYFIKDRTKALKSSNNPHKYIICNYDEELKNLFAKYGGYENIPKLIKGYKSMREAFDRISEMAGISKKLHLHLGRKTRAKHLLINCDLSESEASFLIGNTAEVFRKHYAQPNQQKGFQSLLKAEKKALK
jgi:site-specific recombinase XerD